MTVSVEELVDDTVIATFLERERLWMAYGLCDLDRAYRPHARFLGALSNGRIAAMVLVYAPPGFSGVLPFGDPKGVATIIAESPNLPAEPFLLVGDEHLEAVGLRYRLLEPVSMLRMAVGPTTFASGVSRAAIERLSAHNMTEIEALYDQERNSAFFDPATITHGIYFGVRDAGFLVAIAGTHTWSSDYRIGAIGGVFTHPDYRRRGLASATTGAVTEALLDSGVEDVVLNVRVDNAAALKAYERLGFRAVRTYLEGQATERARY